MKYGIRICGEKIVKRIVDIECNIIEYLNGNLDKHIRCALRQQADEIIIKIVNVQEDELDMRNIK